MGKLTTEQKLLMGLILIFLLAICLALTTGQLARAGVSVIQLGASTGQVQLNLNDGQPIIPELLFQPGTPVETTFFIENNSTRAVYYRLYLAQVNGGLADVLLVTISDGDQVLYSGTAAQLTAENCQFLDEPLAAGQRKVLTATFLLPEDTENSYQDQTLSFVLGADATQADNDPHKEFQKEGA